MKMCAQRKAGRRQQASPAVSTSSPGRFSPQSQGKAPWGRGCRRLYTSHGPLGFITSHSFKFRARLCHAKNEAPEEEAGSRMVYLPTGTSDSLLVLEDHNKSVWPPTYLCFSTLYSSSFERTDTIVVAKLNKLPVSIKTLASTSNVIEINKPPPHSPGGLIEDLR